MHTSLQSNRPMRAESESWFARCRAAGFACALTIVLAAFPGDLAAQADASQSRASLQVSANLVIGYRMHVRQVAPARVVDRSDDMIEVELSLEAASNVAWRLTMSAPMAQDSVSMGRTEVQDASGVWRRLDRSNPPVTVAGERPPCNPTPITIRVRLYDGAQLAAVSAPRFMMDSAARGL